MSYSFSFQSPVQAFFGFGAVEKIKEILAPYKVIGIVSGRTSIESTGMKAFLEAELADKSLHFFSEVEENPSINTIIRGGSFMRSARCGAIIAVGGGSPLDAAKSIAVFAANNEGFYNLLSKTEMPNPPLPVLAVPTTCGTGSEMNAYSIITDKEKADKINFSKPCMFPKWAVIDPALLRTLNEQTLLATAFDAFTHAMEGLISLRANPFSDMCAMTSMELILGTLSQADDLKDDGALANLMYASSLAGVVILHTGTTLLHSLGYYLTNMKKIHHGTANAILLPYFMEMLAEKEVMKFGVIPSLFAKHSFEIDVWLERLGAGHLNDILSIEEKKDMVNYAVSKPNMKSTPFEVDTEFILRKLA
jgi:alcohol dehydrogenase class IV